RDRRLSRPSLPLEGRDRGWGWFGGRRWTPTPGPSPQGGGEREAGDDELTRATNLPVSVAQISPLEVTVAAISVRNSLRRRRPVRKRVRASAEGHVASASKFAVTGLRYSMPPDWITSVSNCKPAASM